MKMVSRSILTVAVSIYGVSITSLHIGLSELAVKFETGVKYFTTVEKFFLIRFYCNIVILDIWTFTLHFFSLKATPVYLLRRSRRKTY